MSGAGQEEEDKKPVITPVASTGRPASTAPVASTGRPASTAPVASTGRPASTAPVASTGRPASTAPASTAKPPESDRIVEGVTPADQPAGDINLKVKGQDGTEVFFRIKRNTQLQKLMNAYCDRQSVNFNSIAFLFDGRRLRGEQTPNELKMEDGDEIDAMLHQTGGGRHSGA